MVKAKQGRKEKAMRTGDMQLLAVNPQTGDFYFSQPNGIPAFMNFASDMTLQTEKDNDVRDAIAERGFKDFRGDSDYSFDSLVEMKKAVSGMVAAYHKAAAKKRHYQPV